MIEMSSTTAIVAHLDRIAEKGYLRRDSGEPRGLHALISAEGAPVLDERPMPLAKARPRGQASTADASARKAGGTR